MDTAANRLASARSSVAMLMESEILSVMWMLELSASMRVTCLDVRLNSSGSFILFSLERMASRMSFLAVWICLDSRWRISFCLDRISGTTF